MQFGWVDFSEADRNRAIDLINYLDESGTVDELGIGVIRDAFANLFFPGTSTIQTRAKYFLICPYIIYDVCRNSTICSVSQAVREVDKLERNCANQMRIEKGAWGVIGTNVLPNGWVARKPYSIYWNGLKTFGILKQDVSLIDILRYHVELKQSNSTTIKGKAMEDDDQSMDDSDAGIEKRISFWNIPEHNNWIENLATELTPEEAKFLEERIVTSCHGSLLEIILSNNLDIRKIDNFNTLCVLADEYVDDELRGLLRLSQQFNELIYAAKVLYNRILLGEDATNDKWNEITSNLQKHTEVNIDLVFSALHLNHYPRLKQFLSNFKKAIASEKWDEAKHYLIKQEKEIKGASRSKLLHPEDYNKWVGGGYLDYRFPTAKNLVADILNAKENVQA